MLFFLAGMVPGCLGGGGGGAVFIMWANEPAWRCAFLRIEPDIAHHNPHATANGMMSAYWFLP